MGKVNPYSHLLEGVDKVVLTEERVDATPKSPFQTYEPYPDHEQVGQEILLRQTDLLKILGKDRAEKVGNLFARTEVADQQLSKLIHSSLDMDRLDYLIRDSQATGVPYGLIDIHHLLNHVRQSPSGMIGITHKAVAAAEHLLLGRSFLFRVVCQHKTTYGFEEVARQLLRRLRNRVQDGGEGYGIPKDGNEVLDKARTPDLYSFTDAFLDEIIVKAASKAEKGPLIKLLANTIVSRRPPRLLWEKRTFRERDDDQNDGHLFELYCKVVLKDLAKKNRLHLGQFLICDLKPIGFESRGAYMSKEQAKEALDSGEQEEMIRVFPTADAVEPVDIVEVRHSILSEIGSHAFRTYRLYFVCKDESQESLVPKLREAISGWK